MTSYLISHARLSLLLCLLAALHTSCSNTLLDLGFSEGGASGPRPRSNSAPAPFENNRCAPQEALCKILSENLAYRGTSHLGPHEDRHDKKTFITQMEALIERGSTSWEGAQYRYIAEVVPMLTVAAHYSTDQFLINYLLNKHAHRGLTNEEIERCLVTATDNAAQPDQKCAILQLLISAFKDSSSYFQGDAHSLDRLLLRCDPSGLLVLINALNKQGVNICTVDDAGNTLLHRICRGDANTYNNSLSRLKGILDRLLKLDEFSNCLHKRNGVGEQPIDVLKSRIEVARYGIFWWNEKQFAEATKTLLKPKAALEE